MLDFSWNFQVMCSDSFRDTECEQILAKHNIYVESREQHLLYVLLAEWLVLWTNLTTQLTRVRFPVGTHDWFGLQYNRRSRLWQICVPLQAVKAQVQP